MIHEPSTRGNILIVAISSLALIILTITGYFFWQNQQLKNKTPIPTQQPSVPQPVKPINETANWKTYSNTKFGYTFKYPPEAVVNNCGAKFCHEATPTDIETIEVGKYLNIVAQDTNVGCWSIRTENEIASCVRGMGKFPSTRWIPATIDGQFAVRVETTLIPSPPANSDINPVGISYHVNIPKGNLQISFSDSIVDRPIMEQILSTFKFSTTPSTTIKKLIYFLPTGWTTVQDASKTFEVGYDPKLNQLFPDGQKNLAINLAGLWSSNPAQKIGSNISIALKPYDGSSRRNFILKTATGWEKLPTYHEIEYTYNGWGCLVLYGIYISQSDTIWGMCSIPNSQAITFSLGGGSDDQAEQIISTVKLLK